MGLPALTYLSFDSMAEGVGWSQVVPYVEGLGRRGMEVTLHSFEKTSPDEGVARRLQAADVAWRPHPFNNGGTREGMARVVRSAAYLRGAELVHARSDMPAASALLARCPAWVWDVRAFWREQRIAAGQIRPGSPPDRVMRIVEDRAARRSAGVVTLSQAALDVLERRHGPAVGSKAVVIPTCVELDRFSCSPFPAPSPVRFLLAGTLSTVYDVPAMIDLVAHMGRRRPAALTVLTPEPTAWDEHLTSPGMAPVRATRADMPAHVAGHHVGFSVLRPDVGVSGRAIMPTKLGEFLASGRPVVVNAGLGDMDRLIAAYDCGVVLHERSAQGFEKAVEEIDRLLADEDTPARCRKLAEDHFDVEKGVDELMGLYLQVVGRRTQTAATKPINE